MTLPKEPGENWAEYTRRVRQANAEQRYRDYVRFERGRWAKAILESIQKAKDKPRRREIGD